MSVPTGKVTVTAIVSIFDGTKQLTIRNPSDVTGGGGGGDPEPGDRIRIRDLRNQYSGSPIALSTGYVQGIVISDIDGANINNRNIVVQDEASGIVLRFASPISVPLGTEVKVLLAGGELSEFRTLVQVQNLSNSNVEVISANNVVTPTVLTVSQIDKNLHESTLVQILDATLTGGATFAGTRKINDSTGNIDCFTLNSATFANNALPSGTVKVTAIVSSFDGNKQVNIRRASDVE